MTTDHAAALAAFLATHDAALRPLLPADFWPITPCKVEPFGPLTKYTLGPVDDGRWAMLHRLREPDHGPPHNHPVHFEAHLLAGGYRETIYPPGGPAVEVERRPGQHHHILPDTIHRITALLDGDSWSLCFAGPVVQAVQFYPELA